MESAMWCRPPAAASAARRLRPEVEELQHRPVFEGGRVGEVDHHLRADQGLFEAGAGDGVDAGIGRGGGDLVTALTQNEDSLGANQAGAANDEYLHGLTFLVREVRGPSEGAARSAFAVRTECGACL